MKKTKAVKSKKSLKKKAQKSTPTEPAKKKVNYLNNKDLLAAVKESKKQGKMTDKLAHMLQLLCSRYARKPCFANYTYNDDMQAYAMLMLVRTWNSFNPRKSKNPFAFFTQCIKNSFIQFLNQEKRQRDIRDVLLVDNGMNPSFSFMVDQEDGEEKEYGVSVSPSIKPETNDHDNEENNFVTY